MRQVKQVIEQRYGDQFTVFSFSFGNSRYAKRLGLTQVTLAVFVPVEDEAVLQALSVTETVDDVVVTVVAIGWV